MASSFNGLVPKDYTELQQQYGRLIYKVLSKYGKAIKNLEDVHSHVWVKLMEVGILDCFEISVRNQVPKTFTAIEVCDFLGISWWQWANAMWNYHRRHIGRWMPTPINLAEFQVQKRTGCTSKRAVFALDDVIQLTLEWRTETGEICWSFPTMGRDVKNGVVVGESRPEGFLKFPPVKVTKLKFQNYLIMSIKNIYLNYCRDQKRHHQERPYTLPPQLRKKTTDTWDAVLPDSKTLNAEEKTALREARQIISEILQAYFEEELRQPVEEQVFSSLENGTSLMKALRNINLPPKICRHVIKTVRPLVKSE